MEFKQLEAFLAVAEEKSFSRAAERVFLSQPTVSAHIKYLEKELGVPLFYRTTKTVTLTDEGKVFLPYVRRMLELKQSALEELTLPEQKLIRLGASTIPSGYLLPDVLKAFRESEPNVFFSVTQSDSQGVEEMVLDARVDIGLTGQKPEEPRLVGSAFQTDTLVFATPATPYYLELKKKKPSVKRLLKEPLILREQGSGTLKATDLYLREQGVDTGKLNIIARMNDLESIKRMIVNGTGTSILSGFAAADMASRGQILTYPLKSDKARKFYSVRLKGKPLQKHVRQFLRFLENT